MIIAVTIIITTIFNTIMKKLSKICKMHPNTLDGLRNACLGTDILLPKKIFARKAQLVCLAIQTIFFFHNVSASICSLPFNDVFKHR